MGLVEARVELLPDARRIENEPLLGDNNVLSVLRQAVHRRRVPKLLVV